MAAELSSEDVSRVCDSCTDKRMSLAIVRTREAPTELSRLFECLGEACSLSFKRNMWSPSADFGFAELYSNERILVVLYIGGEHTELVSLSEIDDIFLQDLEDTLASSNIQSSTIRDGL